MSKPHSTHYFIISYDSITKEFTSDYDKEEELFIDGTIQDNVTKRWSGGYLGDGEYHPLEEMLMDKISDAIDHLNTSTNES